MLDLVSSVADGLGLPLATHAARYAELGLLVLPLVPGGKRPMTSHGKDDATSDVDTVCEWWDRWPDANIGIRPTSGMVVLDVDPRNDGSLQAIAPLNPTLIAHTGGGGWHLYYFYSGAPIGKLRGVPGIDVKTSTGYVVAPPSFHQSGSRYSWAMVEQVAPLPQHIRPRVSQTPSASRRGRTRTAGQRQELVDVVARAEEGNRNNALFWAASRAHEEGNLENMWDELAEAAARAGLDAAEIERTLRSAQRNRGVAA